MTQLALSSVAVEFGATRIVQDVTFTVARGERWGIVGRNGTGKTTLLDLITGTRTPTRGTVMRVPGLRITMLDQHREFPGSTTVWEAAASAFAELAELERSLERQATQLGELGEGVTPGILARYDRDLERFEREGGYTFSARVDAILQGLGFDPVTSRTQPISQLSGGERGRVGLARQLSAPADVLLLDEPTNHLDLETTRWLEEYVMGLQATVLLISHDRAFLEGVVDHVLHLEEGTAIPYVGEYSAFVTQRAERRLTHERAADAQRRFVQAEEEYIRRNLAGQNTRQAKGRRKRLARLPRLSPPGSEQGAMAMRLGDAERGGRQVLSAESVRIAVGERTLIEGLTTRLDRGEVVGLVGPNGSGKSTLLEAIAGLHQVSEGQLRVGDSIEVAHYRQDLTQVPTDRTLYDVINDLRPTWERGRIQGHLGRYGFSGDAALRRADSLSGGERARVALAMLVLARANFLLLDEPTNHLDVESIEALEDALAAFDGSVLLVSHDRALLRALVTRVWSLEGTRIVDYLGSFSEWEEMVEQREAGAAREAATESGARRARERKPASRQAPLRGAASGGAHALRDAVAKAERDVAEFEERVAELERRLHDPALYASAEGARRAGALKADLERERDQLASALQRWTEASEALAEAG